MPSAKPPSRARARLLALGAALLATAPVVTAVLPVLAERDGADLAESAVPAMPSEEPVPFAQPIVPARWRSVPPSVAPVTPSRASSPLRPAVAEPSPPVAPLRFDQSLDELVKQGIVTPAERQRIRTGSVAPPYGSPAHQQACRSGALSEQECSSGLVVRWRGRGAEHSGGDSLDSGPAAWARAGLPGFGQGALSTPLTVPVSALLAGPGGSFSLTSVFAVTPRPAPVLGNGNRRLLFPLIGAAVATSGFGYRLHPVLGSWLMHSGKDLAAPEGTPVVAALGGRVVSSGLAGGYGLAIEIDHDNPRRRTLYGHLSELYVKDGDRVRQGEVIGRVGSTGLSTGPHLHFELRLPADGGWVAVDPGDLDPGSAGVGSDAIALLMGQLLQRLERPQPQLAVGPVTAPRR